MAGTAHHFCLCPVNCGGTAITCASTMAKQTDHGPEDGCKFIPFQLLKSILLKTVSWKVVYGKTRPELQEIYNHLSILKEWPKN